MIDSLLTLTDDHLREHKHLTLSASSSLNTSLKAPPFHLQAQGFSLIFFTPETRYNFPFCMRHVQMCKRRCGGSYLTSVLIAKNKQIGNCGAAQVDSSWQIPAFAASKERSFSALMHSRTYWREHDRAARFNSI